jgi:hypothetical protein
MENTSLNPSNFREDNRLNFFHKLKAAFCRFFHLKFSKDYFINTNLFKNSTFFLNHLHLKFFSLSLHPSKCVLWGELYLLIIKI